MSIAEAMQVIHDRILLPIERDFSTTMTIRILRREDVDVHPHFGVALEEDDQPEDSHEILGRYKEKTYKLDLPGGGSMAAQGRFMFPTQNLEELGLAEPLRNGDVIQTDDGTRHRIVTISKRAQIKHRHELTYVYTVHDREETVNTRQRVNEPQTGGW